MKRYPVKYKPLTQKRLKELITYNPKTGIFKWKSSGKGIRSDRVAGYKNYGGYIIIKINYHAYVASRLAFLWMKGYFPEHEVDHKDRIRHNNKWRNLRHATRICNMRNQSVSKLNKSGVTGVYKYDNKWMSQIGINNNRKNLGNYKTKIEAVQARWNAEVKYGFPDCNTTSTAYLYLENIKKEECNDIR